MNKFMEHPTYEELLAHLEDSGAGEAQNKIKQHLDQCPQCAAELAGWRRTIQRLEDYDWPTRQHQRLALAGRMLKWAAAAVLVLGIGFGFGRLSSGGALTQQAIAATVKQQVRDQLKSELLAALNPPRGATDAFHAQFRRELVAAAAAQAPGMETSGQVQQMLAGYQQRQDENQRMLLTLIARVRQQHETDYFSLRHDLETAAAVADDDLRENKQQLNHLTTLLANQ